MQKAGQTHAIELFNPYASNASVIRTRGRSGSAGADSYEPPLTDAVLSLKRRVVARSLSEAVLGDDLGGTAMCRICAV